MRNWIKQPRLERYWRRIFPRIGGWLDARAAASEYCSRTGIKHGDVIRLIAMECYTNGYEQALKDVGVRKIRARRVQS